MSECLGLPVPPFLQHERPKIHIDNGSQGYQNVQSCSEIEIISTAFAKVNAGADNTRHY